MISALLNISDEEELEAILDNVEKLSLITIIQGQAEEIGIQMHREVQAECKTYQAWKGEHQLSEQDVLESILKVLAQYMPDVNEMPDNTWEQARLYASNSAHTFMDATKTLGPKPLLAGLANRMGNYSNRVQSNFQEALNYYQQALAISQVLYTDNHSDIANSLDNIGDIYEGLAEYEEALKELPASS